MTYSIYCRNLSIIRQLFKSNSALISQWCKLNNQSCTTYEKFQVERNIVCSVSGNVIGSVAHWKPLTLLNCFDRLLKSQRRLRATHSAYTGSATAPVSDKEDEQEYNEYLREICAIPGMGQRVLVIQPDIKGGSRKYVLTTKELKLEETCTLVHTLPNWKVVSKKIVRTDFENTSEVFGSGNFEVLKNEITSSRNISAVVIGIDKLNGLQINTLQEAWGLPVYDRYTIVLQIFKDHAQSPEAKLQVALAEIPYVRSRLMLIHGGFQTEAAHIVGGVTPMTLDRRRMLLNRRESKLKKQLEALHSKRQEVRLLRCRNNVPTVAIVGYTNCGKTTLIKALTEDETLTPENKLFATLDVTAHQGLLASMMKVTYIDTVGFISDMPITLLDAFRATLEDALMADLVIHIRDASHPDRKLQIISVHKTLENLLSEEKKKNVIEVYNKTDLLSPEEAALLDPSVIQISAVTGQGLAELGKAIEKGLLATTNHLKKVFRIPNNHQMLRWLQQEAAVNSITPDPRDSQYLIAEVIISHSAYGRFCSTFSRKK
ncbi:putative GTP-binding protein 6 [Biomphalaria glabrata]|uniref:GTP-binding protein 6 n=1 Tax=Biomphalaria glabrata TaxID=6526 RepID=A0A9U8DYP8_BIOGL|nr:putative GTP-binding protein 6 [Biomphalaria glabrata]XP_055901041.1 putative GTP-binding protein 6 [Biomphalaria glabrata]XP_055901042.1 putative GTP-binding protein 6 [Biomphalaria glabrata]